MVAKKRFYKISCMLLSFLLIIGSLTFTNGYAASITENVKAPINLVKEVEKNQFLVGEEFIINYKIQPQPIPIENILPESYLKDKEIVLVMDSSGSMNWGLNGNTNVSSKNKRITIAKDAAKLFTDKFNSEDNVKIGLVDYDTKAHIEKVDGNELVNKRKFTNLKRRINNGLQAKGATNIGDGLRRAYWILKNSINSNCKKYIILMTDGEPTALSYVDYGWRWDYKLGDGVVQGNEIWNYGSSDPRGYALEYAKTVASENISSGDPDIDTFIIGFSNDVNKDKLQQIADSCNGFYKEAKTATDINEVYEKLAEQIQSDLPIHGIKFQETFPQGMSVVDASEGLEINGQIVTGDIGSISYILNEETDQFEAEPFEFFIKLRANDTGNYNLGKDHNDNNTSYIDYKDIDGTDGNKSFPGIDISVYEEEPPQISAYLKDHVTNVEKYTLDLTIDEPAKIEIFNSEEALLWTRDEREQFDSYTEDKTFKIDISRSDLKGRYITIVAKDKFKNVVEETVPLISLMDIQVLDPSEDTQSLKAAITIETEVNSTITNIKINDETAAENRLTDEGRYTQSVDMEYNDNEIEITIKNQFNNMATFKYYKVIEQVLAPEVSIRVTDANGEKDTYEVTSENQDIRVDKLLNPSIILRGDSYAHIDVKATDVNFFKYQFIASSKKPENMPDGNWLNINLKEETVNEDVVLDKKGYLNKRAYDVSHMPTLNDTNKWKKPEEVFKSPFDATSYMTAEYSQTPAQYGKWEDYINNDGIRSKRWVTNSIFMKNMNVADANQGVNKDYKEASKFWGYIKVPSNGEYKFGAYSDDGCKGYITVGGEASAFVNMFKPQVSTFGTTNKTFYMEADKYYPIYLEYFNWGGRAHFEITYSDNGSSPRNRIPADWFYPSKNITPGEYATTIFTGSQGVKFPSESGDYYIAYRTGKDDDVAREGLYGPFTVDGNTSLLLSKRVHSDNDRIQTNEEFTLEYRIEPQDIVPRGSFKDTNGRYKEKIYLSNVKIQDEYPENIIISEDTNDNDVAINGQKITSNISDIEYTLIYKDGSKVYSAQPINLEVSLTASTPGDYTLSEEGKSIISFDDFNESKPQLEFDAITIDIEEGMPVKDATITDMQNNSTADIIKNGKLIIKVGFELEREVEELEIQLMGTDISKFDFKEMKLENLAENQEHSNWNIDNEKNIINIKDNPVAGRYECLFELNANDPDNPVNEEDVYHILIDNIKVKNYHNPYEPDPNPALEIKVVPEPKIL